MARDLDMIEAMQVLHMKPGDTLVLKTHLTLSYSQRVAVSEAITAIVGDVPVLVLDNGADIGILRQAA